MQLGDRKIQRQKRQRYEAGLRYCKTSSVLHGVVRQRSRKEKVRARKTHRKREEETEGRNLQNKSGQHVLYTHSLQSTFKSTHRQWNNLQTAMTTKKVSAVSHSL